MDDHIENSDSRTRGGNALDQLLKLPADEKERRGLLHTPQEIVQQPATWLGTFEGFREARPDLLNFLNVAGFGGRRSDLVVTLIGAGTSDYIGRSIAPLLRRRWRCHVQTIPSTSLMTELEDVMNAAPEGSRHVWVSFSRSGESFEGVEVLSAALEKYPDIHHIVVTCNAEGQMARIAGNRPNAFCLALDGSVNDRGLAMTSSFTNMVVAGQCIAHIADLDAYQPTLEALALAGSEVLPEAADLAFAVSLEDRSRMCFLGSGALNAVADESSLKVTELTGGMVSAMSESFLGLRHGPLSWLNSDSLVIGFLSGNTEKRRAELGLLAEVKAKGAAGRIVAILPRGIPVAPTIADHSLIIGAPAFLDDDHGPPLDILFAQCLALFASIRAGLKPDHPSADGKIQRVVSQITFA